MGFVKDAWNGITGKTAAKSAEKAGQMQSDSAKYAADLQNKQYEQTRQDQMPWMQAGKQALGGLQKLVNNSPQYNDTWGKRLESAYSNGQLTGGMSAGQFNQDPSYQWRKQQGLDNIQAQAAAGGGVLSGATLKALNEYNSNLASQEYGNAWQRDQSQKQNLWNVLNGARTQDYNLFSNENTRQYNQLSNLAGVGQTTANNLATLGASNASNIGELNMQGANARANAYATASQAKATGMGNLLNLGIKAAGMFF